METERVKIADLVFDPNNSRKHNDKNLSAIKGSLTKFGQQKPIVVNKKNVIIAGNGTVAAAKALGWKEIAVVRSELDDFMQSAFALADNRTSELAEWDEQALKESIAALEIGNFDLSSIGFQPGDFDFMDKEEKIPDEVDEVKEFLLVVECDNEEDQAELFAEFSERKLKCKIM